MRKAPAAAMLLLITVAVVAAVMSFLPDDEATIREWASSNGFAVSSVEQTFFDHGPFPWYASGKGIRFYRVTVTGQDNQERVTYFRLGSIYGPEQRWDE